MIKLELTRAEALALSYMAGNWADAPDIMAAYRSYEKLNAALRGSKQRRRKMLREVQEV